MKVLTSILTTVFALAMVGIAPPALAQDFSESVMQFRSLDDPAVTPDLEVCERAPFYPQINVVFGASFWASRTRASDGEVVVAEAAQVGTATACMLVTDPTFPVGGVAPFHIEGWAGDVAFTATGECTLTSNNIPVSGLVLASCNLKVPADAEQGLLGGIATSNSVFNPLGLPGFGTGSYWTLHLYWEGF
jgi:hypothetical protein